jgi:hypothetical protein
MTPVSTDRNPLFADLGYKVGAIGLAVILWFISISNSQFDANVEFPVEIRNIREGKALGEEAPRTAVLRFRGSGRSLAKLFIWRPFADSKLVIDLERVQQRHVFYLDEYLKENPQRISLPILGIKENLTFVEVVQPDSISIVLGDYLEKLVPVSAQITINPASGYIQVGQIQVDPTEILVKGVVDAVEDVEVVRSMRRTYDEATESLDFTVGLLHPDPGKVLDVSPININVKAVVQMVGERRLEDVAVRLTNVPNDLNAFVSPSTVSITVVGGVEFIAQIDSSDLDVYIDYSEQWSPTNLFVEPQVTLSTDIIEFRDLVPRQLEIITTRQAK